MIEYRIQKLTEETIYDYLMALDKSLLPTLSSRVNIKDYSCKLCNYALHFCAFDEEQMVGIVAGYFNDPDNKTVYISSFSVIKSHRKKGIASTLLKKVIHYAISKGFSKIDLQVYIANESAITFYENFGFNKEFDSGKNEFISMSLIL
ncbi:MAG: GNAT family N-acetyltransferase [Clostridiaceae bacterium]|nr:GNAT family N-acetyltransferase [Clostridiaceae bacterium]